MSDVGFRIFPPKRAPREVVKLFADFPTPNISDNMSRLSGASGEIRPMHGQERLLGSAFTVRTRPGDNLVVHKALDMLEPGDALVIDAGGDTTNAILGEIMMRIAVKKGATGIVVDGAIRDAAAFAGSGFPCFARGASHRGPYKDGPGEINVPITVGGAVVRPGDIVVGDPDGVVAVPLEEAEAVAEKVRETVEKEATQMREIDEGTLDRSWIDRTLEQRGCRWIGFEERDRGDIRGL
jgi:regulator of RNase E activity RraA